MSDDKKRQQAAFLKTFAVRLSGAEKSFFLLAARQIEEVLQDVDVQPLPFAPEWLLGLCAWRQQILPAIDVARLYGVAHGSSSHGVLHLVVRVAVPAEARKDGSPAILRCVLKVCGRLAAMELPAQSPAPADAEQAGIAPSLVRGIFAHENGLLIVPNLLPAVCSDAS